MSQTPEAQAEALITRGRNLLECGDPHAALPVLEEALARWRQLGNPSAVATALHLLALAHRGSGAPLVAREPLLQLLAQSRELDDRAHQAVALLELGYVASGLGETERAVAHYAEARAHYRELGERVGEGAALYGIGKAYLDAGESQTALPWFADAFPLLRGTDGWTPEVAQMAQLADTMAVTQRVFGALRGRGRLDLGALQDLASTLHHQAEAGSDAAAHLGAGMSRLSEGLAAMAAALSPQHRLPQELAALAGSDPQERAAAARRLAVTHPPEALTPLLDALAAEREPRVTRELIQAFRAYGDPACAERLRPLLGHDDLDVRLTVVLALVELGEAGLDPQLLAGLQSEDAGLRAQVLQLLERRADPALLPALLPMLRDRDPKVRTKAVYAVGALHTPRALDDLAAATHDRAQTVRWAAVRVLGDLG
ncbi:MAG: HEAT repeat domain-containing protein, partial [Chloroflexales bacterium]|nr:HEAT repeat domain-containing protein [Chloroflexales bacterium]